MKKLFFLVTAMFLLSGCGQKASVSTSDQETTTTTEVVMSGPVPDQLKLAADPTIFTTIAADLKKYQLVEIPEPFSPADMIQFPMEGSLLSVPVRFYRLNNTYFALLQHMASATLIENNRHAAVNTGVWYADMITREWHPLVQFTQKTPDTFIENNPFHLWQVDDELHLLAIDDHGAGSGEGVAKELVSKDGGAHWQEQRCFYYTPDDILPLSSKNITSRKNFSSLIEKYLSSKHPLYNQEYILNPATGNYEFSQRGKETGEWGTYTQEDCRNISL